MNENLIPALAAATYIACLQLADQHLASNRDDAGEGAQFPHCLGCDDRVADYPDIFSLLADCVDDPATAEVLRLGPGLVRDLALAAGPAANGIIINSNRRLLTFLRAGDADAAEHEMDRYIRCLSLMSRLARGYRQPPVPP